MYTIHHTYHDGQSLYAQLAVSYTANRGCGSQYTSYGWTPPEPPTISIECVSVDKCETEILGQLFKVSDGGTCFIGLCEWLADELESDDEFVIKALEHAGVYA